MFSNTEFSVASAVSTDAFATVLYSADSEITSSLIADALTAFSNTEFSVASAVSTFALATAL